MVSAKLMIQLETASLDATVDSFGYYMSQVATEVTLRVLAWTGYSKSSTYSTGTY